jgi:hypothetical protein
MSVSLTSAGPQMDIPVVSQKRESVSGMSNVEQHCTAAKTAQPLKRLSFS